MIKNAFMAQKFSFKQLENNFKQKNKNLNLKDYSKDEGRKVPEFIVSANISDFNQQKFSQDTNLDNAVSRLSQNQSKFDHSNHKNNLAKYKTQEHYSQKQEIIDKLNALKFKHNKM